MEEVNKIYTSESPMGGFGTGALLGSMMNKSNTDWGAVAAALASNNNGLGGNDSGLALLILILLLGGNNGFGWGNNGGGAANNLTDQVQALSNQVSSNHNSDLLMSAVNGNHDAIHEITTMVGANFAAVNTAICQISNAIQLVNGTIGTTGERVINATQMSACQTLQAILNLGYQNQLANCQQTNQMLQGFNGVTNTVQNGFTSLGYQLATNACEVKQTSTENTQKIIDTLQGHWNLEQQTTIQQLRDEIGRLNQTNTILAAYNAGATGAAKATA